MRKHTKHPKKVVELKNPYDMTEQQRKAVTITRVELNAGQRLNTQKQAAFQETLKKLPWAMAHSAKKHDMQVEQNIRMSKLYRLTSWYGVENREGFEHDVMIYLEQDYRAQYFQKAFEPETLAVYVHDVKSKERTDTGILEVTRHVFLVVDGLYIVDRITGFEPLPVDAEGNPVA